jgi:hypothetical protein
MISTPFARGMKARAPSPTKATIATRRALLGFISRAIALRILGDVLSIFIVFGRTIQVSGGFWSVRWSELLSWDI